MNNTERVNEMVIKALENLQDYLQGLKACVRGENRHSVVIMIGKLQEAIVCLNQESESD